MKIESVYILSLEPGEGWIQCDEIKDFVKIETVKKFTEIGTFSLTVPVERATHLVEGNWILFGKFIGLIKKINQNDSITGSEFTVSGKCAKIILGQRVIVPPSSQDDLIAFDEITGTTETCIKHYVKSQLTEPEDPKRILPRVSIAPDSGRGNQDDAYYARYEPVFDAVNVLSVRAGLGFDVFKTEYGLCFDVIFPRIRTENQTEYQPIILDMGTGLSSRQNEIDHTNEVNALYCTRAGYEFEDESFTQTFFRDDAIPAGFERHEYAKEISVDSAADDPYSYFEQSGIKELEAYEPQESCEVTIDPDLDVLLGDWVTLVLHDTRKIDRQITEITETWTCDGCKKSVILGEKYLTKFEKIQKELKKEISISNESSSAKQDKKAKQLVEQSVAEATELMARAQGFYSFVKDGVPGWPNGRYISGVPENETTIKTEVWVQSIAGYAHYPGGVSGKPATGMFANDTIIAKIVSAGIVNSESIQADAITTEKLAAGAITAEKIAANAITADKIKAGSITADKIDATNLKVNAANITGMLTANQIDATNLKVNAANITGMLTVKGTDGKVILQAGDCVVNIGGWSFLSDRFQYKTSKEWTVFHPKGVPLYCADGLTRTLTIGVGTPGKMNFGVTNTGQLYASDIVIPSGTLWLPYTDNTLLASRNGVHLSPAGMYIQMDDTKGGGTYVEVDRILVSPRGAPNGQFIRGTGIFEGTIMLANGVYDTGSLASGAQYSTNGIQFLNSEVNAKAARIHYGTYNSGYSGMKLLSNSLILASGSAIENDQDNKIVIGNDPSAGTGVRITGYKISANKSISVDSDRNLKHDIESLEAKYADLLDLLRPVRFKYNEDKEGKFHMGFIAQEVQEAMQSVGIAADEFGGHSVGVKGTQSLAYEEFIALIVYELQRLKKQIQK